MWESALIVLLVVLLFLLAFLLVRTLLYGKTPQPIEEAELVRVDGNIVAEHLAAAIRHRTVSETDREKIDYQPLANLQRELQRMYPRVHATLKLDVINRFSLLYTWKGRIEQLEPVLLAAHLDVVPIDPASRDDWRHPPFDGHIEDGQVWGRGTLDTKNTAIAMFEAVETLIKTGFQPERTILLALGHDEEIGGFQGAAHIAGRIQAYNARLAAVLDEGGAVATSGVLPGLKLPVAMIGVAEKGYMTLQLQAEAAGGHSSMPPRHTTIGVLARAIQRLENNPMPVRMEMIQRLFEQVGSFLPFGLRLMLANMWLFRPLVNSRLSANPRTNAMVRTSSAVTIIQGGVKDNILPAQARAAVNYRLYPGDRIADVVAYARKVINDDAVQLDITSGSGWEASPISAIDSPAYRGLLHAVGQVYPQAVAAPYLVSGATDARHYGPVCDQVYRFSPMLVDADDIKSIHSTNEHIAIESLAKMVQFYLQLIKIWGTQE